MTPTLAIVASAAAGLLVGVGFFGSLHWLCGRLVDAGAVRWGRLLGLHLLRWAVLVGTLAAAAHFGALALAAHAAGVLVGRSLWLRRNAARTT
jgi:hypothetical protein